MGEWAPVVVKLSSITHPEAQAQYVHREVYGVMRSVYPRLGEPG